MSTTILKLGGELLDDAEATSSAARSIVRLAAQGPLVVVHGGGRAIDAELRSRGETPRFVDGLRVTDAAALDAVVSVLAGRTNTALVAAIGVSAGRAVGLTGADGLIGMSMPSAPLRATTGDDVDLGLVGQPVPGETALLHDLLRLGYIPVVASIGITRTGGLLNINADTFAGHLATVLRVDRLIIAGGTAGVLDSAGQTIRQLTPAEIDAMTSSGAAHSGMVAKLVACRRALEGGVREVSVVSGRGVDDFALATGTRIEMGRSEVGRGLQTPA